MIYVADSKSALEIAKCFNEVYHFKSVYGSQFLGLKESEFLKFMQNDKIALQIVNEFDLLAFKIET